MSFDTVGLLSPLGNRAFYELSNGTKQLIDIIILKKLKRLER
jgi:hypothetical protein